MANQTELSKLHSRRNSNASSAKAPSALVRKQFAESIKAYGNRTKELFLLSGEHYRFLADYLDRAPYRPKAVAPDSPNIAEFMGVIVRIYSYGDSEDRARNRMLQYKAWEGHTEFQQLTPPDVHSSHLVFIRGWQTREWLRVLGAHCHVDPELFRRHLEFIKGEDLYDLPGLPSISRHICQLRVTTIIKHQVPFTNERIRKARDGDDSSIVEYLKALQSEAIPGISIVRRYACHNDTTSTVEQVISLSACRRSGGGWIGVAWLDDGVSLNDGLGASWTENSRGKNNTYDPFVPVIQHKANVAFLVPQTDSPSLSASTTSIDSGSKKRPCQSGCLLPLQYGTLLDPEIMRTDALYAFSDLFVFAASSENQFLSLVQKEIDMSIRTFDQKEEWALENLRYNKALLDEHIQHTQHIVAFLRLENNMSWPQAKDPQHIQIRNNTKTTLLEDYEHLLERTQTLATRAMEGMHVIMNDSMLKENMKAMEQTREVGRLSLLAFFFLPLSFASSIFGMNFVDIKEPSWIVCAVLLVFGLLMVVSAVMCWWDSISRSRLKSVFSFFSK